MQFEAAALQLLVERVEGNLLAAAQEVDKLALALGAARIDSDAVRTYTSESSRFDVFQLFDCLAAGNLSRSLRIMRNLHAADLAPPVVVWALARELRLLATLSDRLARGAEIASVFKSQRIWASRQGALKRLARARPVAAWRAALGGVARLDRICKGMEPGDVWQAMERFCLAFVSAAARGKASNGLQ